ERRAQPAGAEEHEALVLREHRLVVRALRVDPEFQQAARAMECSGHASIALQLAHVADVDKDDVVLTVQLDRRLNRQGLDLAIGVLEQLLDPGGDGLRHGSSLLRLDLGAADRRVKAPLSPLQGWPDGESASTTPQRHHTTLARRS